MRKQQLITFAVIFILVGLLVGCTQQTNNNNNNKSPLEHIELIDDYVVVRDDLVEVNGVLRNNGTTTLHVAAIVLFYNAENELIYSGTYTIYNFVNGTDAAFFVMYRSTDPNFEQYDHYDIQAKLSGPP